MALVMASGFNWSMSTANSIMNPAQHPAPAIDGYFDKMPNEVVELICDQLLPHHGRNFGEKKDLVAFARLNRNLKDIARKVLFRDITITFTLKDQLPAQLQRWRPQAWETPDIVRALQNDAKLRGCVRSLQLRLHPFPVWHWTLDGIKDIKARMSVNTPLEGVDWNRYFYIDRHSLLVRDMRSLSGRQNSVVHGYSVLYAVRCCQPRSNAWTVDLGPTLQQLMSQLPTLQHVETADAESSPYLANLHPMRQWSLSYSDALLIQTAPRSVRSISVRSWPPANTGAYARNNRLISPSSGPQRSQSLIRDGAHFRELAIDITNSWGAFSSSEMFELDSWRDTLQQLRNLTTLTLSPSGQAQHPAHVQFLAQSGGLDPALNHLLNGTVVLQHLRTVTLLRWTLPVTIFSQKVQTSFPSLERMRLHSIVVLSDTERQGEERWMQLVDGVKQNGKVSVTVREPKVCTRSRRRPSYTVFTMSKQATLRLEGHLKQKAARQ